MSYEEIRYKSRHNSMVLKYSNTLDWTKDSPSLDLPKPAPNVAAT